MSLLEIDHVSKRYGSRTVLDEVSFEVDSGELVAVWGERRSGRSTLIRICGGAEPPDSGTVRFSGELITKRRNPLGHGIGYVRRSFGPSSGRTVLDQLVTSQLARRTARADALAVAWRKLVLTGADRCARARPSELSAAETIRVAIARALTAEPRLLVVDEPVIGVELLERDPILELLAGLTSYGIGVLMSAAQGTGLLGADRVVAISKGRIHGQLAPEAASVTTLASRRVAS